MRLGSASPTNLVYLAETLTGPRSYYDNTLGMHDECNAVSGGFDWSFPTNLGSTACGPSVMEMHTNSLVAMNVTWLNLANPGRANLCGRE